ncbi:hypothetical protein ID0445_10130 [Helicobacter pylori]
MDFVFLWRFKGFSRFKIRFNLKIFFEILFNLKDPFKINLEINPTFLNTIETPIVFVNPTLYNLMLNKLKKIRKMT